MTPPPVSSVVAAGLVAAAVLAAPAPGGDPVAEAMDAAGQPVELETLEGDATRQLVPRDVPHALVVRTDAPPRIDGRLDDLAWEAAVPITELGQVEPVSGAEPSEATEVRLLYDANALYVGVRCFDREPGRILASQMRRDGATGTDDTIAIIIDPFFDRRNGFFFELNPVGSKRDALTEDNDRFRQDWDGIWDGGARIDEEGWTAEFAIPFKTLSFDANAPAWSLNVRRQIRRRNEEVRWSGLSQNADFASMADAGVIEGIDGELLEQGAGIDLKPFFVGTARRDHDDDFEDVDLDAGLDLFWKLRPELTLSLTANTDFAETEVDERRVNLTRFPLFFPEKRDFFLQDAGIFEFGGIRRNPLPFFSRRIGLGSDGRTRDILAGAKLTGRLDDFNVGLLSVQMQDDDVLGRKNLSVARVTRNVLEQSSVGAIFTYGDPNTAGDNAVAGIDFSFRDTHRDGSEVIAATGFLLGSETSGATGTDFSAGFKLGAPNDEFDWQVGFTHIGEDYNAALGFVPRKGIREYFANARWRWRPESIDWLRRVDTRVNGFLVTDLDDVVESQDLSWTIFDALLESQDSVRVSVESNREQLFTDFEIQDGVVIPAGDYRFARWSVRGATSSARPVNASLEVSGGEFFDGDRTDYTASADWRVSRHLNLGGSFILNDVDLPGGDFITRIARARVNVYFTRDVSWTSFVQYDSVSESVGVNSRLRWIVEPGSEVFLVLNQSLDRDRSSLRVTDTELTTKVGWTFRF